MRPSPCQRKQDDTLQKPQHLLHSQIAEISLELMELCTSLAPHSNYNFCGAAAQWPAVEAASFGEDTFAVYSSCMQTQIGEVSLIS